MGHSHPRVLVPVLSPKQRDELSLVSALAEDMGLEPTRLLHPTRFPGELLSHSVNPPCPILYKCRFSLRRHCSIAKNQVACKENYYFIRFRKLPYRLQGGWINVICMLPEMLDLRDIREDKKSSLSYNMLLFVLADQMDQFHSSLDLQFLKKIMHVPLHRIP